jgi:hypothetical protein
MRTHWGRRIQEEKEEKKYQHSIISGSKWPQVKIRKKQTNNHANKPTYRQTRALTYQIEREKK